MERVPGSQPSPGAPGHMGLRGCVACEGVQAAPVTGVGVFPGHTPRPRCPWTCSGTLSPGCHLKLRPFCTLTIETPGRGTPFSVPTGGNTVKL